MNVEIINLIYRTCKRKIASLKVSYGDLVMHCELAYYAKEKKVWVRMPERWDTRDKKVSYCYWPSKEISDQFQKEVLKKVFDKYDLTTEQVAELHELNRIKSKHKRNG